jgi:hypothetical protein
MISAPAWAPTVVTAPIEVFDTSTYATLVSTDQGEAFLKALGSPEGPHTLICELVGTRLARWLGLRTLDAAIVELPSGIDILFPNGQYAKPGPAFATRAEKDCRSWAGTTADIQTIENVDHVAGLVVFDTWTRNCDRFSACAFDGKTRRNERNVFLSPHLHLPKKWSLRAMDHTHCFTCGRAIERSLGSIASFKDSRIYGLFPEFVPHLSRGSVAPWLERLATFSMSDGEMATASVPPAWDLSESLLKVLRQFVKDRADYLLDTMIGNLASRCGWV